LRYEAFLESTQYGNTAIDYIVALLAYQY